MLAIHDLSVSYGLIEAVKSVNFEVKAGEIVSLIGANGAGKTSILRTLSGLETAKSGRIVFDGADINKWPAQRIVASGLAQVPEGRHVFPGMTVLENLQLGAYLQKDRVAVHTQMSEIFDRFPRLGERKDQDAATLSGGEQQMLAMGRSLMSRPKLLLLDEPSMGLAPLFIQEIFKLIVEINQQGTTVLLVEQNAHMALKIADRGYVLENGRITLHDTGEALLKSEAVQAAYLGHG